ncbi:hypothetical protein AB6A40_002872 [Gnathostoma spinigerum]|uniref:Protein kinase domain-containing protein n=1 Tax=Gnathostoma spinigerum TaxID=75299 RepID=A0ABD6E7V2_9BILA
MASTISNFDHLTVLKDRLPKVDETVKSDSTSYKLTAVVGEGGYGIVFQTQYRDRQVALKAEKYSKSMLHVEISVLKAALKRQCQHLCELYDYGSVKPSYVFVVMTLLGSDLHRLRNEQIDRRFSMSTAIRVGIQTFKAIEELHRCGFISRDVKPGNFAIGLKVYNQHRTIFLFDFGLARKYIDKNGKVLQSRGEVGWRGTTRYGSLKAHLRQDLGRRDDLESWLYILIENTRGMLPWKHITDRASVQIYKLNVRTEGRTAFLRDCPRQYDKLLMMIDGLVFEDEPKYNEIFRILDEIREERDIKLHSRFDWDEDGTSTRSVSRSVSPSPEELMADKEAIKDNENMRTPEL